MVSDHSGVLRSFRINVIVRVLLLSATLIGFALLLPNPRRAAVLVCGLLGLLQVLLLIRYVETTNRNLHRFLSALEFSDFGLRIPAHPSGKTFDHLREAFHAIQARIREAHLLREESRGYLDAVVQHVGIGLIGYRSDGTVELINGAAKTLFNIPTLRTIADLGTVDAKLPARLLALEPGTRDLVTVSLGEEILQLALHATELRQRHETIKITTLQNISLELNEKEMEAWQNLIRVLTHEIKNSLTPISSLAASVEDIYLKSRDDSPENEKACAALQIIQRRSQGLLDFVDTYRDLTHIPKPEYSVFRVDQLFAEVAQLMGVQVGESTAKLTMKIQPESMVLTADPKLIEQVVINLVLNALEANAQHIRIEAEIEASGRPVIRVHDDGCGIVRDSLQKVFIPFYSTRKGGSGVGLSLSRQIMRLHRGDLVARSEPGRETVFTMRF